MYRVSFPSISAKRGKSFHVITDQSGIPAKRQWRRRRRRRKETFGLALEAAERARR